MENVDRIAFSIYSKPGVYAVLAGSGISRPALIPTGWEVILDLLKKEAIISDGSEPSDPYKWYVDKFSEEPSYSKILESLGKTPAERSLILKNYFEPSEEELEENENAKQPTLAHRSIAKLSKEGFIKVILTTNFDRLFEKALSDEGVSPTVISTPDSISGAMPFVHSGCTLIKLHGDYLDERIKNTISELDSYDDATEGLLDRIFDEFGIVVCGWSGEWDTALRSAIERAKGRRFTTYWTHRGELGDAAKQLCKHRDADLIKIESADKFWSSLTEKIDSVKELSRSNPTSKKIAVASLKRFISRDEFEIKLHDLLFTELRNVTTKLKSDQFSFQGNFDPIEVESRLSKFNSILEILQALAIIGAYWSKDHHHHYWIEIVEDLANCVEDGNGLVAYKNLRLYPALLIYYSIGISAIKRRDYSLLNKIFFQPKLRRLLKDEKVAVEGLNHFNIVSPEVGRKLGGGNQEYTPLSNILHKKLEVDFKDLIPDSTTFNRCFNEFEYLATTSFMFARDYHTFKREEYEKYQFWAPVGRFGWENARCEDHFPKRMLEVVANKKSSWEPLKAGMFDGNLENIQNLQACLNEFLLKLGWD